MSESMEIAQQKQHLVSSTSCPKTKVQYTEHYKQSTLMVKAVHKTGTASGPKSFGKSIVPNSRIVRISITDADATDCSSDDEEMRTPRRVIRRFVNEVRIQECSSEINTIGKDKGSTGQKAVNGRRKRRGGIMAPETASVCKKFRGVRQRYNSVSGQESHNNLASPNSVLGKFAEVDLHSDDVVRICTDFGSQKCDFSRLSTDLCYDLGLSGNFFGTHLDSTNIFVDSYQDFVFGSTSWVNKDSFQDLDDLFGLDQLVAL